MQGSRKCGYCVSFLPSRLCPTYRKTCSKCRKEKPHLNACRSTTNSGRPQAKTDRPVCEMQKTVD